MAQDRIERRLAAILAADVAGYSRLMGLDEEGTLTHLQAHRRDLVDLKIIEHRGRIVKTTGDGLLVEFASVVDALRCAVEVQRKMVERNTDVPSNKRIDFRVGINVGDVIVEDKDIFGDGVNVASRLEGLADPGGICVSGRVEEDVRGKIDVLFEDIGDQHLKNIARPVRVYRVRFDGEANDFENRALSLRDKPSIVVLPFNVIQGSSDDEAFADGLTEDIITALSRIRALFVIARNSSFSYRDRGANTREIGRNLGVRYVLEGSIRRSGERLRFTAQLVEAASGNHIWAEKYDRPVGDIFDLQDDLTRSVTASTQTHIALEEGARAERTERPQLNVWLLIKRSWGRLHDLTPEGLAEARSFAERALELAPRSGLAHEVLSVVLIHQVFMRTAGDVRVTLGKARDAAMRAAELEGSSEYAFWALGMVQFTSGEPEQAILTLRQGLEINPNCALLHATIGNYLALMGQADESIAATELAMRINPRDPSIFFRYQALADAYFVKRDFEKMVAWASKGVVVKPSYFGVHARAISGLGLLGRIAEAQTSIQRYLKEVPQDIRSRVHSFGFVRDEDSAFLGEGLRKGGFPADISKVPR